jgi:ATP-dependent DNA helicase RecG
VLSHLPIGMSELLSGGVETSRLEFKGAWDEQVTGHQVIKVLCSFANDLQNLNGGYVLIGVAEKEGRAVRPVVGLNDSEIDAAQKWLRGNCNRIDPLFMPVFDVVEIDEKKVLVLWAPASDIRPHQAPDGPKGERKYWIRVNNETIEAKDALLTSLLQQTARIPFDDRRSLNARTEDLSITLVREFLQYVNSDLRDRADSDDVYKAMQIVAPVNGHWVPKNIGLLFFANDPSRWFRGARIEVVRQCLTYLDGITSRFLEKRDSPQARSWASFPLPALREALVNAVYHRGYENSVEPTKVYLYPDRVEVISYPGPVDGIKLEDLNDRRLPPVPARNRRIGEYFKELRLAESRGTGLPKIRRTMADNGSPPPTFDFDEGRTYFRATLPAHPEYVMHTLLLDYAFKQANGDQAGARQLLLQAWNGGTRAPKILQALISDLVSGGDLDEALTLLQGAGSLQHHGGSVALLAKAYADVDPAQSEKLMDEWLQNSRRSWR